MPGNNRKPFVFCWKIVKYLIYPIKRLRKFRKNNMKQYRIAVGVLAITSCFVTFLLYYWYRRASTLQIQPANYFKSFFGSESEGSLQVIDGISALDSYHIEGTPMKHLPLNEFYPDGNKDDAPVDENNEPMIILDTPGCHIPLPQSTLYPLPPKGEKRTPGTCGNRAVYLKKVDRVRVKAMIKLKRIKKYLRKSVFFECCYRFIQKSNRIGEELKRIRYTPCKKFIDGDIIPLKTEFINVKCNEQRNNISHEVYDDVYAFIKKSRKTNRTSKPCKLKYNVLLLGMDTMSKSRFENVMIRSIQFLFDNYWLGFTAFNKVGENTIPNLMAALTGLNMKSIMKECANKMENCHDLFIWRKFQELGYVTAYGEDFLRLPDTFSNEFRFSTPPTDHYMRPLFLKGERETFNRSLVCNGKIPSGQHLLDYALDFALTYRTESFFGLFWMNSFSHNVNSRPEDADNMIENFLNRLTYTGVLENTFVVLFSDHGIRFGDLRMHITSYYDERLPMMFMWVPTFFRGFQVPRFDSLMINQFRLTTPYDLYNTLVDIYHISNCDRGNETEISVAKGCPNCHSLFSVISENRTCTSASIHQKWCTCHKLFNLDIDDVEASLSVRLVVSQVRNMTRAVQTKHCWRCRTLSFRNVNRLHFYFQNNNLYHVIALTMVPENVTYEATVHRSRDKAEIVGPLSLISVYRGLGKCVVGLARYRKFCVCQKIPNCV